MFNSPSFDIFRLYLLFNVILAPFPPTLIINTERLSNLPDSITHECMHAFMCVYVHVRESGGFESCCVFINVGRDGAKKDVKKWIWGKCHEL